jgi:hypothetical protein
MGARLECVSNFVHETSRKILLGRPRRRWEGNIKMNLRIIDFRV